MKTIYEKTDLNVYEPEFVLKQIPSLHATEIDRMTNLVTKYNNKKSEYNKLRKGRIEFYMLSDEAEYDIQSIIKSKEDRDIFLKNSNEEIIELEKSIKELKNKIDECERNINYLKGVGFNIQTMLDYQKFRNGQWEEKWMDYGEIRSDFLELTYQLNEVRTNQKKIIEMIESLKKHLSEKNE